ncbi:MAG TPA: non-heme iron oxygenase ferredoxin subunit [Acidiferrobacteraceae bacterium]|nr:non-heme iron oxygenase ferredoxin subunit [Acidiferrobacteraceae bacterium]
MRRIDIDGHRLLLANVEGKFYVADDTCTHEDASLCTGSLKGELVKCPLHGSRFDLKTGKPLEDPAEEYLKVYPVTIEGDNVLIEFE